MESPIYLGTEKPGKLLLKFAVPCFFLSSFPVCITSLTRFLWATAWATWAMPPQV